LPVACCRLHVVGCMLSVASCRLHVEEHVRSLRCTLHACLLHAADCMARPLSVGRASTSAACHEFVALCLQRNAADRSGPCGQPSYNRYCRQACSAACKPCSASCRRAARGLCAIIPCCCTHGARCAAYGIAWQAAGGAAADARFRAAVLRAGHGYRHTRSAPPRRVPSGLAQPTTRTLCSVGVLRRRAASACSVGVLRRLRPFQPPEPPARDVLAQTCLWPRAMPRARRPESHRRRCAAALQSFRRCRVCAESRGRTGPYDRRSHGAVK
jgi:hypothetical protein